jgi:uncharacterized membrane protein
MNERQLTDFQKRLILGVATANFLAVIQLVAEPQFQIDWKSASSSVRGGQIGMVLMIVNVPLSFALALYSDLKATTTKSVSYTSAPLGAFLCAAGLAGLAFTLGAFRPVFSYVGIAAITIAIFAVIIANWIRRKRRRRSN